MSSTRVRASALAGLLICLAALPAPAGAQPVDEARVDAGLQIYKVFGQCWACHGWSGTGGLPDVIGDRNAGPPLTPTKLDRAQMIEMVSCGRPGGEHPPYARDAWSRLRPCYGKTRADLKPEEQIPDVLVTLTEGQIESVVMFVQAFFQGQAMNRGKCLRYFGVAQTIVCDPFAP